MFGVGRVVWEGGGDFMEICPAWVWYTDVFRFVRVRWYGIFVLFRHGFRDFLCEAVGVWFWRFSVVEVFWPGPRLCQAVYCDLRSWSETSLGPDLPLIRFCPIPWSQSNTSLKRTQMSPNAIAIAAKIAKNQAVPRKMRKDICIAMIAASEMELGSGKTSVKHLPMNSHDGSAKIENPPSCLVLVLSCGEVQVCLRRNFLATPSLEVARNSLITILNWWC